MARARCPPMPCDPPHSHTSFPPQQYLTALEASTVNFVPDGAVGSFQMPAGLSSLALVAVAAVAGGAFVL